VPALFEQLSREFSMSDRGIVVEIEIKNDNDDSTGRSFYLQLLSIAS